MKLFIFLELYGFSIYTDVNEPSDFLGADWALYTPVKKIHLDDDVGLKTYAWTSYKSPCSPVICSD